MTIRLLIADDHRLLREGLRALLERRSDIEVVGEAGNGRQAVALCMSLSPDIVVMDVGMEDLNGIDATRQIVASSGRVRVIALSMHSDSRYVLKMLEAGASGYVLKAAAGDELLRAVDAVHRGDKYLSSEITGSLVEDYVRLQRVGPVSAERSLGGREREVLQLVAEGRRSSEVARLLHISAKTVEAHRRNIMKKLGVHTIAELTKYAVREGLTSLDR
jgi:DNA-binding NarL/FixJ family response regulator